MQSTNRKKREKCTSIGIVLRILRGRRDAYLGWIAISMPVSQQRWGGYCTATGGPRLIPKLSTIRSLVWRSTQLSPGTFCTFARELSSWGLDRLTAQTPPFRWAMLSGGAPRGDDQSHDHRPPPSATLRPPVTRARSTHRGPDHRH